MERGRGSIVTPGSTERGKLSITSKEIEKKSNEIENRNAPNSKPTNGISSDLSSLRPLRS